MEKALATAMYAHNANPVTNFKAKLRDSRIPRSYNDGYKIPDWAEVIDRE